MKLSHAHKNEVDAAFVELNLVALEHGYDLACDFAGSEIALHTEFGGEAELAIDRATDLA